ncbi:MAG: hypothetical protein IT208_03750 [Chthonomonadales bacterium]|nr:hypothetical protein [Chthonomonadales bacterium]
MRSIARRLQGGLLLTLAAVVALSALAGCGGKQTVSREQIQVKREKADK